MDIRSVGPDLGLSLYRVIGGERQFVELDELAVAVHRTPLAVIDDYHHFCTQRLWKFIPWVSCSPERQSEVYLPEWGAGILPEDCSGRRVFVDAGWGLDVLALYRMGVHSLSGCRHYHAHWPNSPCGHHGMIACMWKDVNRLIRGSDGAGYMAIVGYPSERAVWPKQENFPKVPKPSEWSRQPVPMGRYDSLAQPKRVIDLR